LGLICQKNHEVKKGTSRAANAMSRLQILQTISINTKLHVSWGHDFENRLLAVLLWETKTIFFSFKPNLLLWWNIRSLWDETKLTGPF